jgi:hypothetical protein
LSRKFHTRKAESMELRRHRATAPIVPRISMGHSTVAMIQK